MIGILVNRKGVLIIFLFLLLLLLLLLLNNIVRYHCFLVSLNRNRRTFFNQTFNACQKSSNSFLSVKNAIQRSERFSNYKIQLITSHRCFHPILGWLC